MKKKTQALERPTFSVVLTKEATKRPKKYLLSPRGKWVGVGGDIHVKPKNGKPFVIKEATPEEYLEIIFKDGKNKHLGHVKFI